MQTRTLERLLALAVRAAQTPAEGILIHGAGRGPAVEHKADGSPVTVADREAETAIRAALRSDAMAAEFDILGEELGRRESGTRYRWLIDPIDGTRSFVNRIPLFGTIVALEDREAHTALIGVIHLPVLNVTCSAARGLGCRRNGAPVSVSGDADLATSLIAAGDVAQFVSAGCEAMLPRLLGLCRYVRGYTDCFGHALVVGGAVGAMIDPALNPWDAAATEVLVEEAGGAFVTRPSRAAGKHDIVFGAPKLVEQLVTALDF